MPKSRPRGGVRANVRSSQQSCDDSGAGERGQAGPGDRAFRTDLICPSAGEGSCAPCSGDEAETAPLPLSPKAKVLKVKKAISSVSAPRSIWRETGKRIVQVNRAFSPSNNLRDLQLPGVKDQIKANKIPAEELRFLSVSEADPPQSHNMVCFI